MKTAHGAALLRRLQLLVLAIVTMVAAGAVTPASLVASLACPARVAASATTHASRWTSAQPLARPQESAARPALDRDPARIDALNDDLDDLDDDEVEHRSPMPHVTNEATLQFPGARLSRPPGWDFRGHPQFDRSRFRTGRGLLRGPPV